MKTFSPSKNLKDGESIIFSLNSVAWRLIKLENSNNIIRRPINHTKIMVREGPPLNIPLIDLEPFRSFERQKIETESSIFPEVSTSIQQPETAFSNNVAVESVLNENILESNTEITASSENKNLLQSYDMNMHLTKSYVSPVFDNLCVVAPIRSNINNELVADQPESPLSSSSIVLVEEIFIDDKSESDLDKTKMIKPKTTNSNFIDQTKTYELIMSMSSILKDNDKETDRFKRNLKQFNEFIQKKNIHEAPFNRDVSSDSHKKKNYNNCNFENYKEENRKRSRLDLSVQNDVIFENYNSQKKERNRKSRSPNSKKKKQEKTDNTCPSNKSSFLNKSKQKSGSKHIKLNLNQNKNENSTIKPEKLKFGIKSQFKPFSIPSTSKISHSQISTSSSTSSSSDDNINGVSRISSVYKRLKNKNIEKSIKKQKYSLSKSLRVILESIVKMHEKLDELIKKK